MTHSCRTATTPKRDQFWKGPPPPKCAWAALDRNGEIMTASIRDRSEDVKLACGECVPVRVMVTFETEPREPPPWPRKKPAQRAPDQS